MHLRLDALFHPQLALGNDLGMDMRAQIARDGIDSLVFLFDPDGECGFHKTSYWPLALGHVNNKQNNNYFAALLVALVDLVEAERFTGALGVVAPFKNEL